MGMMLRRYHEAVSTVEEAAEVTTKPVESPEPEAAEAGDGAPAGNASKAEWHAYALSQGFPEEALEGRSRDELRDLFND